MVSIHCVQAWCTVPPRSGGPCTHTPRVVPEWAALLDDVQTEPLDTSFVFDAAFMWLLRGTFGHSSVDQIVVVNMPSFTSKLPMGQKQHGTTTSICIPSHSNLSQPLPSCKVWAPVCTVVGVLEHKEQQHCRVSIQIMDQWKPSSSPPSSLTFMSVQANMWPARESNFFGLKTEYTRNPICVSRIHRWSLWFWIY